MPLVVLPLNYGLGRIVEDFYQKNRLRQNVILTTNTVYTAIGLVRKGIGMVAHLFLLPACHGLISQIAMSTHLITMS